MRDEGAEDGTEDGRPEAAKIEELSGGREGVARQEEVKPDGGGLRYTHFLPGTHPKHAIAVFSNISHINLGREVPPPEVSGLGTIRALGRPCFRTLPSRRGPQRLTGPSQASPQAHERLGALLEPCGSL